MISSGSRSKAGSGARMGGLSIDGRDSGSLCRWESVLWSIMDEGRPLALCSDASLLSLQG